MFVIVRLTKFFRCIEIVFCIERKSSNTSKNCRIWHLNNLGFCWHETRLVLAMPIYFQENVGHWRHSEFVSSWKNWHLDKERTAPASITDKMHSVWTGQAGYKQKECQALPRQDKIVFRVFLPLKMVCQLFSALEKVVCPNVANES